MKPIRVFCVLLCMCLLFGCGSPNAHPAAEDKPPVHVTYTPDPTAAPSELIAAMAAPTASPDPKAAALLYAGERISVYRAYRQGDPGFCVEETHFGVVTSWFQELPNTEGLQELTVTGVQVEPKGEQAEGCVDVCYLDDMGAEWIFRVDLSHPDLLRFYLLPAGPGLELMDRQRQYCGDLMLMGYLYEYFRQDDDWLSDPAAEESLAQRYILDALYYNYKDELPPYLTGEGNYKDKETYETAVVSQTELEAFFQSALGRPNLVPDRTYRDEDEDWWSELLPGQVPLPPTDWHASAAVEHAVQGSDGTVCLYGRAGTGESFDPVVCRVRPVEGFLGGQVIDTEIYRTENVANDPAITFAP